MDRDHKIAIKLTIFLNKKSMVFIYMDIKITYMKTVKIVDLVAVPELKSYYSPQPIEELLNSIQSEGQKTKVVVSPQMEIIDGYRIVDSLTKLGINTIEIEVVETDDLLKERIARNTYRIKTEEDQVEELRTILKSIPKSQGKKQEGISRAGKIVLALGHKWQDEETINKVEFIMDNDFENKILSKAVVMKNQSVESCFEFLKKFKAIDEENNFGFSKVIKKGELSCKDANKIISEKMILKSGYKGTFIIPEKCTCYNEECTAEEVLDKYTNKVDLIFTSPPYWNLRKYDGSRERQLGQEATKEEYCYNVAAIFKKLSKTIKETGNCFINIGETYSNYCGEGIPFLLRDAIIKHTDLVYKETIIWSKKNPNNHTSSKQKRPTNSIEYILWFVVNPKIAKYKKLTITNDVENTRINKGFKNQDSNGKVTRSKNSVSSHYKSFWNHIREQDIENAIITNAGTNYDVHKIISYNPHPAIMSSMTPVCPILWTTDELDLIFDPFGGTNVVSHVGLLLNRCTISTEISEGYFQIGCRMLENAVKEFNRKELDVINELVNPDDKVIIKKQNLMETSKQDNQEFFYPEVISSEIKQDEGLLTPEEIAKNYWPEDIDTKEKSVDIPVVEIGEGSYIFNGNNIDVLKSLPNNSIDSAVTDPPYGISFMGKKWDYDVPTVEFWKEVLRVLKPGGHVLSFSSARTYHRMTDRIEDAGFEIRDQIMWIYGSGMPKSHNVALSIDKSLGFLNRGHKIAVASRYHPVGTYEPNCEGIPSYEPKSEEAKKWKDWGTGLKPAHEPIVLARKPLSEKTHAKNVLKWGTSGLNIYESRINVEDIKQYEINSRANQRTKKQQNELLGLFNGGWKVQKELKSTPTGRWPSNILFNEDAAEILDLQSKNASRFFYIAKASKKDKGEGLESFESTISEINSGGIERKSSVEKRFSENEINAPKTKNIHPTVKPTELMQYLVRMVTPPNGITIDPFFGSGSTGKACIREGFKFIGIEQSKEYYDIALARCEYENSIQNPIEKISYSLN
jgi:DNA modification methylase